MMLKVQRLFYLINVIVVFRESFQSQNTSLPVNIISYPSIRRNESVIDVIFGEKVADPYRWLEDPDSLETKQFVSDQNAVFQEYIEGSSFNGKIKNRLTEMFEYERYSSPIKFGRFFYYWFNSGLQNHSVLLRTESLDGEPSKFLDPNELDPNGLVAVQGISFSESGLLASYTLSQSGSDWLEVKFKRTDPEEDLEDVLTNVKFTDLTWTHDDKGIFYNMYPEQDGKADGTETTKNTNQRLMYHVLGTNQSEDILCAEIPDQPTWFFTAEVSDCGRYVFISIGDGTEPNNRLYYHDLASTNYTITGKLNLVPIVEEFEAVYSYVTNNGTNVVLRTNLDAPFFKLITIDLIKPNKSNWKDLVPQEEGALLAGASAVGIDKLIINKLRDIVSYLSVHQLETGEKLQDLEIPLGTAGGVSGRKNDTTVFISFSSFLTPGQIFLCDLTKKPVELKLFRESRVKNFDSSQFVAKQIFYESKDKTRIPMFILHQKNKVFDGNSPCRLYGYGGFGVVIAPFHSLTNLLLLRNFDGIAAIANIRGGGEYGQPWHDAGRLKNKQNSFDDFQAAAEYLISNNYTRREKLYINGESNGGLLVSACINQRPDLFGAAVAGVPVCDMLRFHMFTIGNAWITDYGNPEKKEDFEVLLRYSPLHNVRIPSDHNIQYPATLLLTADHDDRVVPLHTYKFLSTLQYTLLQNNSKQTNPILARIETNAGHGSGKPLFKAIEEVADILSFVQKSLHLEWKD